MFDTQHKVIGEAAYALLLRREEVTVASLLAELVQMAGSEKNPDRQQRLAQAQHWLRAHRPIAESDNRATSVLRGMSQRESSVKMPNNKPDSNR